MEQEITTVIEQAMTYAKEQHELSQNLPQKQISLKKSFPSFNEFAIKFNPKTQIDFSIDIRKTIMGNYSTLQALDEAYGNNSSSMWLTVAITDINEFCGSKSMSNEQIKDLSRIISHEYKNMKFSVLQLFFYKFKCGDFGKFYGKIDPMVITCALKDFAEECEQKREEYQTEEYLNKVDDEDTFRKDVYRYWYNLCQELFSLVNPEDKDTLTSIDVAEIYTEDKCLEISLTKQQYELLTGTYKDLFSTLKKKYFSNIVKLLRYKLN